MAQLQTPVARYYTPLDPWTMNMDDNYTITQVATDDNFNQTWDTVWATSDYMLEPVNNPQRGWPVNRMLAIGRYVFPYYLPQSVRITRNLGMGIDASRSQHGNLDPSKLDYLQDVNPHSGSQEAQT